MTLEYVHCISPADVRRLRARGIENTNALLHVATLGIDRERLSKKTGISPERLLEFAHQCALLEISGIDRFLPVVRRLGINSLKELRVQDPRRLHESLAEAVGYAHAPTLGEVQYWVGQARAIDMIELDEPATRP